MIKDLLGEVEIIGGGVTFTLIGFSHLFIVDVGLCVFVMGDQPHQENK